ncbi:MAG: hypothetical protein LKG79_01075 [Furfurilactobacillus sp.]|jgi:hypothetical protein|uniref:Uncharacterized protein n=2 Tax=Furfurilactobacillus TaxID=2767882 RepID=A0A0R1RS91_9LACO|nr:MULTISPECIES: SPJ_0845 family protein [Furfurilactobacillus]KRL57082.1 hypothetical protein FD35_GL000088 [Furfurilactobacillus rossiae DSM 15814]MCF6159871.1 hypothetical protein [Furfurilactobacillus milii]MCF6162580.1 hypothetical protein [Furfurilactobacillus milii]MCF6165463.1 hypothetical protein [Furfurilactobacillus rossiae]MCF6419249.1 hypothetical protein [Furfurilactobacillus milii]
MGLTFKRQTDLDKLFDQFAVDPDDIKDPNKTPLKREHLKDEAKKDDKKKADK